MSRRAGRRPLARHGGAATTDWDYHDTVRLRFVAVAQDKKEIRFTFQNNPQVKRDALAASGSRLN